MRDVSYVDILADAKEALLFMQAGQSCCIPITLQGLIQGVEVLLALEQAIVTVDPDGERAGNDISDEYRTIIGEVERCIFCTEVVEPEDAYIVADSGEVWNFQHKWCEEDKDA